MPEDTIVAIATPPGRGGIGVVRLSGTQALEIACSLIHFPALPLETQRATLGDFRDPESERALDKVVVTCFRQPHSYTAEDVVEISCHGAPIVLRYLVECCLARGARAAEPGEFTLRAFLNGRIDLTQAEAIRDLIESRTLYQARVAAQQMGGAVSTRLKPHKQALLELIARLEAGIDFAEDDVSICGWPDIVERLAAIRADLEKLVEGYEYGRIVREGLTLAIVGRPNVGKSSLFNRLLNQDRAIVTPVPGTTRDLVAETASLGGIPLRLVDTAGIRDTADEVESIGVQKAWQAVADSDLRLLVVDASEGWTTQEDGLLGRIRSLGAWLVACNKCDLPCRLDANELDRLLSPNAFRDRRADPFTAFRAGSWVGPEAAGPGPAPALQSRSRGVHDATRSLNPEPRTPAVWTSALTGEGIPELQAALLQIAAPARDLAPEGEFITDLRHQQLIQESLEALARARQAADQRLPHEMLLLDLYDALRPLDTITGATTADDVLGIIFSTFCVGK
jgi:tRNA modification GTPase